MCLIHGNTSSPHENRNVYNASPRHRTGIALAIHARSPASDARELLPNEPFDAKIISGPDLARKRLKIRDVMPPPSLAVRSCRRMHFLRKKLHRRFLKKLRARRESLHDQQFWQRYGGSPEGFAWNRAKRQYEALRSHGAWSDIAIGNSGYSA